MADALRKVKSGDPLRIPAVTFNTFVDAARDYLERRQSQSQHGTPAGRDSGIVLVRNDSGSDRQRFDILAIDSPIFTPADALESFQNERALVGTVPSTGTEPGRFAVLQVPIAAGELGRAVTAGATPVKINVADEQHLFAELADGQTGCLDSGETGSAAILWKEAGTGEKWALVRIGSPCPAGRHDNPKVLGGTGQTADAETWDIDNQEAGYNGVQFVPFRLYWSGTSGNPVYQFVRTPTYDSIGRLIHVSAEVRTVAFNTGPCEV